MNYTLFNIAKLPIVTSKIFKTIQNTKISQQYIFANNNLEGSLNIYYKTNDFISIPQSNRIYIDTYFKVYDKKNNIALYENSNYRICINTDNEQISYYINLFYNDNYIYNIYIKQNPIIGKHIELKLNEYEKVPYNFNELCDESRDFIKDIIKRI
jgi:hypothetical protein